jgi:hypothetical protein
MMVFHKGRKKMTTRSMKEIRDAKMKVAILWNEMCKADDIPADAKFVEFSKDNPHSLEYNAAMQRYQLLMREFRADPSEFAVI